MAVVFRLDSKHKAVQVKCEMQNAKVRTLRCSGKGMAALYRPFGDDQGSLWTEFRWSANCSG